MLNQDLARYVTLHHSLGFRFRSQRLLLATFVRFAEARGDAFVRTDRVIDWAARAPSPAQRRNRLLTVRRFALAMRAEDDRHEAPAADSLGPKLSRRMVAHIYTPGEITQLIAAAATLQPAGSIRPLCYATLFGLLAATGMRVSEALALQIADLSEDGLVIRKTKFQKSRLLPLHETTRLALDRYLRVRLRLVAGDGALFVSSKGSAVAYSTVEAVFLQLARSTGLRGGQGQRGPRIHDLRHSFAVRSLEQCRHTRDSVARHIVALSTYLGHAHVSDTYWYLQATPLLMEQIAAASEALHRGAA